VSHSKIRTEKICLNCGTETTGRYCPACGQENIEPKQSVWHLITHFFSDLTHFDGKFFITVKDLFAKPGFLSREYMMGRRVSYLDPIRMYIFTSAIFFLILLSAFDVGKLNFRDKSKADLLRDPNLRAQMASAKTNQDSLKILKDYLAVSPYVEANFDSSKKTPMGFTKLKANFHSQAEFDSVQKALPVSLRDGWLKRIIESRKIEISKRYEKEGSNLVRELISNNMHNWPKVLFISLPIFALLLKMLYFRHKQFYYVDHGIFTVHLYIFSFLILLAFFGVNAFKTFTGWSWLDWLILLIVLYPFFYYYKAMRRFYGQSGGKTILKYIILFILSFFVYLSVFIGAVVFTLFEA
jgi:Protein of unknown function (DUF3667)